MSSNIVATLGMSPRSDVEILMRALHPDAGPDDFAAVENQKEAILGLVEDPDVRDQIARSMTFSATSAAQVYAILGGRPASDAELDPLFEARADDIEGIGRAFGQVLIPRLPPHLRALDQVFAQVERAAPDVAAMLRQDPSVVAAEGAASALPDVGLTPVLVAEATRAVANLASRQGDRWGIGRGDRMTLDWQGQTSTGEAVTVTRAEGIRAVTAATEVPNDAATCLFEWLAQAATHVPGLFDGFDAHLEGGRVLLSATEHTEMDLYRRWNGSREASAESH